MKLIVGLGNPGIKYQLTRHNIGFLIIDKFSELFKSGFKAGKGDWAECKINFEEEDVYLLKPLTYMNNSGIAIKEFSENHNINIRDVLIVVDDFQIPLGTIRLRKSGTDGGHNGLSSIVYHLNSIEFARMRVGIGKDEIIRKEHFIDFVLGNFEAGEIKIIKDLFPVYSNCISSFIRQGVSRTMNIFNKSFLTTNSDNNNTNKNSGENEDN
ncbi:MAG: aminoacyl-tRNA hydrolase [Ignavibacteria bacterium]